MDSTDTSERGNGRNAIWVFTPSRTDPRDLEYIFVQRQHLLKDAVERVRESALTEHKHHLLFVGPRGCGKTHLVTLLVSRLSGDDELTDRLHIAWLNEDETCTTVLELLLKIHAALKKRYPDQYREEELAPAFDLKPDAALEFVPRHLLDTLGSRTLVIVTENLDAIFEGLGPAGQKQLRSFIQEHPKLSIVATAQRLVEDLSDRASPFFGFFQTEHLKVLNVEQATELLQNIARLQEKTGVVEFLATSRGRSRVRAIHHLSGGNHRIYIVLSQFITRDSVDALLEPFMKMVDELTPYYQERIRWLPPMQRKIVEYLCTCEHTVPVKEIAKRLFATSSTISSQLQDLREKGYVEANQRGRESLYEISEPLMRICVEVKDNQRHQPLRLLVDFLRVWYDDQQLKLHLGKLESTSASCVYLESAIQRNCAEGNLRKQILLEDLEAALSEKISPEGRARLMSDIEKLPEAAALALQFWADGNALEAVACVNEELAAFTDPSARATFLFQISRALIVRGIIHGQAGDTQREIEDYTAVIGLPSAPVEQVARALANRGFRYGQEGDTQREVEDCTAVIGLSGAPTELLAWALVSRGIRHGKAGDTPRAIDDYTAAIGLPGAPVDLVARALANRAFRYGQAGDTQREIDDYTAVIGLPGAPTELLAWALVSRGIRRGKAGDTPRAIDDYTVAIGLPGAPVDLVARALANRGFRYGQAGDTQREIDDYTAVIGLPGVPAERVAVALYNRGYTRFQDAKKAESMADFEAIPQLAGAPTETIVAAHIALSELHCSEGRWSEGYQALQASLDRGSTAHPVYRADASDLVGVFFSAGLSPDGRLEKVTALLRVYGEHNALPVLGEAVVQHIGSVFRAGAPFPSADNLEGWASAWEQASAIVPDFQLSMRLLRTGVDFIKAGGKDLGILLSLTSPERSILEQSLGLATTDDTHH